jgi:hypothetical protein
MQFFEGNLCAYGGLGTWLPYGCLWITTKEVRLTISDKNRTIIGRLGKEITMNAKKEKQVRQVRQMMGIEFLERQLAEAERVIKLLVAAGLVSEEKVEQAREQARELARDLK